MADGNSIMKPLRNCARCTIINGKRREHKERKENERKRWGNESRRTKGTRGKGRGGEGWDRGGSRWRERKRDEQRDYARDIKPGRGKGWEMGRTREMRYRLQPADKSKVIGPSGILRSRTTKSTASSRYVATYVHMYQDITYVKCACQNMYSHYHDYVCTSRRCAVYTCTYGLRQRGWLFLANTTETCLHS